MPETTQTGDADQSSMPRRQNQDAVARVARAFETAHHRLVCATDAESSEDETSNCLHHLYRLAELHARTLDTRAGRPRYTEVMQTDERGELVLGLLWLRGADTHRCIRLSDQSDAYSNYYTTMFEIPIWTTVDDDSDLTRRACFEKRSLGRSCIDTLKSAEEHLVQLLSRG